MCSPTTLNYYSILLSLNSINHRPNHQGIAYPTLQIYLLSPIKKLPKIWDLERLTLLRASSSMRLIFWGVYFSSRAPVFKYLALHTRKNTHSIHTGLLNRFSGLHVVINFSNLIWQWIWVFVSINCLTHCFDSFNVYFIIWKSVLRKEVELALFWVITLINAPCNSDDTNFKIRAESVILRLLERLGNCWLVLCRTCFAKKCYDSKYVSVLKKDAANSFLAFFFSFSRLHASHGDRLICDQDPLWVSFLGYYLKTNTGMKSKA